MYNHAFGIVLLVLINYVQMLHLQVPIQAMLNVFNLVVKIVQLMEQVV